MSFVCMATSCRHSQTVPSNTSGIDNSEYVMANRSLLVTGVGESRNHQQAISKSRTSALDSAVTILRESVNTIAAERGFQPVSIEELQLTNTRVVDQHTTAYNNDNGIRIYRSTQTLCIDIESSLKDIFDKLGTSADYGWYMFLHDIDRHLDPKNSKQ